MVPSLGIMLFLKSRKPSLNSSSLDFVSLEFPFVFLTKGPSVSTYLKSTISTLRPISSLAQDRVPFNQEHWFGKPALVILRKNQSNKHVPTSC